jgi:hypothetical protein
MSEMDVANFFSASLTPQEELTEAFDAYNKNMMTDRQVEICHDAILQLNHTLFAMREKGQHLQGYLMTEHSLERIRQLRGLKDSRPAA